jgi:hypothetical protein
MNASTGCGAESFMERAGINILVRDVHGVSLNDIFMHVSFSRGIQGTYKVIMLLSLVWFLAYYSSVEHYRPSL